MPQAQQRVQRNQIARIVSLPAPVGGWNARDALGSMKPTDAIRLVNFFPTPSTVDLRHGMIQWSTGLGTQVNAVMAYNAGASSKLFAAAGAAIYDCTAGGAVGAAVVSGLTGDKWIHVNVATAGGNFLLLVNGTDKLRGFNGSAWWRDGDGAHDITGIDTATCSSIYLAKQRVWLIEHNSLRAWYLPTLSIAGAATSIDFGSLCRSGGYLVAMAEWTVQGGFGIQDLVAFVTSEGELLIYQGSDPSSPSTWSLVGIWNLGAPMGSKCFSKFGADLLLICTEGLVPLSQGRFFSDLGDKATLTDKIQAAISDATTVYAGNFGWDIQTFPLQNMLLLNVPVAIGQQEQYVMNTITGAWARFTGWAANCWELYGGSLYYGENGTVNLAWSGFDDAGTDIRGDAKQAFNYFGSRGALKQFLQMRPTLSANGSPTVYATINADFDDSDPQPLLSFVGIPGSTWDSARWDAGVWASDTNITNRWQGTATLGYCGAPRLKVASRQINVKWAATDIMMEVGGAL